MPRYVAATVRTPGIGVGRPSSSSGTTALASSGARSFSLPIERSDSAAPPDPSLRARFPQRRECLAAHEAERDGGFRRQLRVGQVLRDVADGGRRERAEDAAGLERRLLLRDVLSRGPAAPAWISGSAVGPSSVSCRVASSATLGFWL